MNNHHFFVRNIQMDDLNEISRIHITSFHERALTQLGRGAVTRYYSWLLKGFTKTFPICVETHEGTLAGFCFSGNYSGSFSGFLREHTWYLVVSLLLRPWLIFNSLVRDQARVAYKTLRRNFGSRKTKSKNKLSPNHANPQVKKPSSFGILSIAVLPSYQRQGIGELLMCEVENYAFSNGYSRLHLSVHPENLRAVKFYEKLGWERSSPTENWDGKMFKNIR